MVALSVMIDSASALSFDYFIFLLAANIADMLFIENDLNF